MTLQMMRMLIERLYKKGFYEIIFVLLMVHRKNAVMSHVVEYLLLDGMVEHWNEDKDNIIKKMLEKFE